MSIAPPIAPPAFDVPLGEPEMAGAVARPPQSWPKRIVRGKPDDPAWARPGLLILLAVTAGLYLWDLGAQGWANAFYSAAVQAGTKSWKAFFFGSFDSSNFITVDKPPASLWIMELSARTFGLNSWSILVPQALEGVAAVGVLYATIRRWFSPAAGLIGGAVLALTPVAALMFRYNNPDALLVLLLVVAAYATVRALERGHTGWLVLAGTCVGFGFLTKMLQALVVVPAIALVYLLAGPPKLGRRIVQLLWGGLAMVVSAGWWVAAVELTPAADRPYIGGSRDNNLFNLVFGYNGFGRITGNETGSVGAGGGPGGTSVWGPTGWTRMFNSSFGTQASWLIPAALVALGAVLWMTRRAPRQDRTRAAFLLWGGWLIVTAAVFSFAQGIIHPYYTVALAPAIGALVGMGALELWRHRHQWFARAALGLATLLSALWAFALLGRTPAWFPWLRGVVLGVGIAASVGILVAPIVGRHIGRVVALLGIVAGLAGPLFFTVDTAGTPASGAIPTAGPTSTSAFGAPGRAGPGFRGPAGVGGFAGARGFGSGRRGAARPFGPPTGLRSGTPPFVGGAPGAPAGAPPGLGGPASPRPPAGGRGSAGGGLLDASSPDSALVKKLQANAGHYTRVAAAVGANTAAGYQLGSGDPVMAIGGFNGTDPDPSLADFKKLVAEGKVHYFIAGGFGGLAGGFGGLAGRLGAGLGTLRGGPVTGPTGTGAPGTGAAGGPTESEDSQEITSWVESRYRAQVVGGVTLYDLTAPKA